MRSIVFGFALLLLANRVGGILADAPAEPSQGQQIVESGFRCEDSGKVVGKLGGTGKHSFLRGGLQKDSRLETVVDVPNKNWVRVTVGDPRLENQPSELVPSAWVNTRILDRIEETAGGLK